MTSQVLNLNLAFCDVTNSSVIQWRLKFRIHSKTERFKARLWNVRFLNGVRFWNEMDKMAAILFGFQMFFSDFEWF